MQVRKKVSSRKREEETAVEAKTDADREAEQAKTDALLDEIDELLAEQGLDVETEAQDFVDQNVQKGGE